MSEMAVAAMGGSFFGCGDERGVWGVIAAIEESGASIKGRCAHFLRAQRPGARGLVLAGQGVGFWKNPGNYFFRARSCARVWRDGEFEGGGVWRGGRSWGGAANSNDEIRMTSQIRMTE
jgi:hypothetical protein